MSISSAIYTPEFQNLKQALYKRKNLPFADLVERVRDELDLEIMVSLRDREKIPAEGRLLIAANHPLASKARRGLKMYVADVCCPESLCRNLFHRAMH